MSDLAGAGWVDPDAPEPLTAPQMQRRGNRMLLELAGHGPVLTDDVIAVLGSVSVAVFAAIPAEDRLPLCDQWCARLRGHVRATLP
jgi:hypothetical protein